MLVGLVCAVAPLLGDVAARPLDVAGAAESWWQQWHWWALATLGCGAIWLVLRFPSKESSRQDSWPASHPTGAVLQTTEVAQRLVAGREGEARVRALFLTKLPTGTWVLNNLLVPGLMGDIDLLVVGANGVFLQRSKPGLGQSPARRTVGAGAGYGPAEKNCCPTRRHRLNVRFTPCGPTSSEPIQGCAAAPSSGSTGLSCLPIRDRVSMGRTAQCRRYRPKMR